MIEKAKTLPADEVFLDLEDAVAPEAKTEASPPPKQAKQRKPQRNDGLPPRQVA